MNNLYRILPPKQGDEAVESDIRADRDRDRDRGRGRHRHSMRGCGGYK